MKIQTRSGSFLMGDGGVGYFFIPFFSLRFLIRSLLPFKVFFFFFVIRVVMWFETSLFVHHSHSDR